MARLINRLTAANINGLAEPGFYADGMGLYLQISKWQTKSWVLRFTVDGRTRWLGLGSANTVRLSEARELARKARLKIADGVDPIDAKRVARDNRRKQTAENTLFRDAVKEFLRLHLPTFKNDKHRWQWGNSLDKYAMKNLGSRHIGEIDAALVNETLSPIWQTKAETARRVKQRVECVVQWVQGRQATTPAEDQRQRCEAPPCSTLRRAASLHGRAGQAPGARCCGVAVLDLDGSTNVRGAQRPMVRVRPRRWRVERPGRKNEGRSSAQSSAERSGGGAVAPPAPRR